MKAFLLHCHLYSASTHNVQYVSPQSLPIDENSVLASLAQTYRKTPSELTFAILHHIRNAFGHSLQNRWRALFEKRISLIMI